MFSDSHCHLLHISQKTAHFPLILEALYQENFPFIMDIGTDAGDFTVRYTAVADAWNENGAIPECIHFSVGVWPSKRAIERQETALSALRTDIQMILESGQQYAAIGECGIDRYWNRADMSAAESSHGTHDLTGEECLFKRQLRIAKEYGLAAIIHSRNGFEATLRCIDEVGWHKGVIHCFSYGKAEAEAFLKRGWYLSFSGSVTYPTDADEVRQMEELVRMVPADQLLLETDAPYLSPHPIKRELNTPLHIPYTYRQMCKYRQCSIEELCTTVHQNCKRLFSIASAAR